MRLLGLVALVMGACGYDMPVRDCSVDAECTFHGSPGRCLEAPSGRSHCAFASADCPDLAWGPFAGSLSGMCVSPPAVDGGGAADSPLGIADAGADAGCTPDCLATPVPRWPWNGATTGSIWATDPALPNKPRRPTLRWDAVDGATSYQVQIDNSCSSPGHLACSFPSPTLDEVVTTNSFTPAADLTVSNTPPRGTRYYWRVRACINAGCSEWSPVRYMDVGRAKNDFNGDGYSDVVVGAPGDDIPASNAGRAYLLLGEATRLGPTPVVLLNGTVNELFGSAVAFAGDVNADGFADIVAGSGTSERVVVIFGNAALDVSPAATLPAPGSAVAFGSAVAGAGDVDSDGFADILVGASGSNQAFLYRGGLGSTLESSSDLSLAESATTYGGTVAGAGDLNGDGAADFVVGAPSSSAGAGGFFVYLGSSSPDGGADAVVTAALAQGHLSEGLAGGGDRNGDLFGDLLGGQPRGLDSDGIVYVFHGADGSVFDSAPDETLEPTAADSLEKAGHSVAACDVDGDGLMDVAFGAPAYDVGGTGAAYVSMGTTPTVTGVLIDGETNGGHRGSAVTCSDVTGDGVDDLIVAAAREGTSFGTGVVYLFIGVRGASLDTADDSAVSVQMSQLFGDVAQ